MMPEAVVLPLFVSCACSGMPFLHLGTKIGPFKALLTIAVICCHDVSDGWVMTLEKRMTLVPVLQPGHRLVTSSPGTAPSLPTQLSAGKGESSYKGFFPLLGCPKAHHSALESSPCSEHSESDVSSGLGLHAM